MNISDFKYLQNLIKNETGVILNDEKNYLFETRLQPVMEKRQIPSLKDLVNRLKQGDSEGLLVDTIHAMTTHESFFFRDGKPFIHLKEKALPLLFKQRAKTKKIRIWCAACSNGQEPYSISMILDHHFPKEYKDFDIQILATDISEHVLVKAKNGIYSDFEVQRGLDPLYREKYFHRIDTRTWRISNDIISSVDFQQHNLMNGLEDLGSFDIILCRNVLIYFDVPLKKKVLDQLAKILSKDGYLYLGGAETPYGICDAFKDSAGIKGVYRLTP